MTDDKLLFDDLVDFIQRHVTDQTERRALIESAFVGTDIARYVDMGGNARDFTINLLNKIYHIESHDHESAIVPLLEEVMKRTGTSGQESGAALVARLRESPSLSMLSIDVPMMDTYLTDVVMRSRVFISYARGDDEAFVQRLYDDLVADGHEVWFDRESLASRGNTFLQEIRDAIDNADRVLLVVGPAAVESVYVRYEWEHALKYCKVVIPLLRLGDYDLIPEPVGVHHAVDVREERDPAGILEELQRHLQQVDTGLASLMGVPDLPPHFQRRPDDEQSVIEKLLADINTPTVVEGVNRKTGVNGMGGIGKSVLASSVAHDCGVRRAFSDGIFWVTVGENPNLPTLQANLGGALGDNPREYSTIELGRQRLALQLEKRKVLLIVDDIWNVDHVKAFEALGERCRMLITTRDGSALRAIGAQLHSLDVMDDDAARKMLASWSGMEVAHLPPEVDQVVEECGNLPLALAIIGAMAADDSEIWPDILEALQERQLEDLDFTFGDPRYSNVYLALDVSVSQLDDEQQARFTDLAVFPDDTNIPVPVIGQLWGMSRLKLRRLVNLFVDRSLIIRNEDGTVRLHDLIVDYVRYRVGDDALPDLHRRFLAAVNPQPIPWHDLPDDNYTYINLAYHLRGAGRSDDLHDLLIGSPAWMERKAEVCRGDSAYNNDLMLLIGDYDDPLTAEQTLKLAELHAARQVVAARVGIYVDSDLKLLARLGRRGEALSHAYLRTTPAERARGLMAIYEGTDDAEEKKTLLKQCRTEIDRIRSDSITVATLLAMAHVVKDDDPAQADTCFLDALQLIYQIPRPYVRASVLQEMIGILKRAENTARIGEVLGAMRAAVKAITVTYDRVSMMRYLLNQLAEHEPQAASVLLQELQAMLPDLEGGSRSMALSAITTQLARQQMWEAALEAARSLEDVDARSNALRSVAEQMAQHALWEQALDTARSIENEGRRGYAMDSVVEQMAQQGMWDPSLEIARGIEKLSTRASALRAVAKHMAQQEMPQTQDILKEALEAVRSDPEGSQQTVLLWNLSEQMSDQGMWDTAVEAARMISNPYSVSTGLQWIAGYMAQQGMWDRALETAQTIEHANDLAEAMRDVVKHMAQQQMWDRALETAQTIEDDDSRTEALRAIAEHMAPHDPKRAESVLEEALEVARGIEDKRNRSRALQSATKQMAEQGMWDTALGIARSLEDAGAIQEIVKAMAEQGMWDRALDTARSIEDDAARVTGLNQIAEQMTQQALPEKAAAALEEALVSARSIEDTENRSNALINVAKQMAQQAPSGEHITDVLEEALQAARSIEDPDNRSYGLINVARQMSEQGLAKAENVLEEALETVNKIEKVDERRYALGAARRQMAKQGMWNRLLEMAEDGDRDSVQRMIVEAMAEQGMWDRALEVTQSIADADTLDSALQDVVEAMTEQGMWDRALEVTQNIADADTLDSAMQAVVEAMAEQGMWDRALDTARDIEGKGARVQALVSIADQMSEQGMAQAASVVKEALKTAHSIEDTGSRSYALANVAEQMAKQHLWELALDTIPEIEDTRSRTRALASVATHMAQQHLWDRALEIAQDIEDAGTRANTLRIIGTELAQAGHLARGWHTYGTHSPEGYMGALAAWQPGFATHGSAVWVGVLARSARVVAWARPSWAHISELLSE